MTRTSKFAPSFILAFLFALIISFAPPAYGGILNGHGDAVTFPGFTGSVSFDNGAGLEGDLDFAVFTAAEFDTAFPTSTYSPTDPVVYTYQLTNTGTVAISQEIVGITNPKSGIGSFENAVTEQEPSGASFVSGNAVWSFFNPKELDPAEVSWVLVFSSPNAPTTGGALTIDGGTPAQVLGVPTPGGDPIPEPSSFILLTIVGLARLLWRRS